MFLGNILKINPVSPQHDGSHTAINNLSVGEKNLFIVFGFARAYPTVQERSENQNVDSSLSRSKNTNSMRNTTISNSVMKICVKYTTSDRGSLELQNRRDCLS